MQKILAIFSLFLIFILACSGSSDKESIKQGETNTKMEINSSNSIDENSIKIINYTKYETSDLEEWVNLAASKMKSREARILLFIYPVGEIKRPEQSVRSDYADSVFMKHEVLLTQKEIDIILKGIEEWFAGDSCLDSKDIKMHLNDYRAWLEQGADASTMHGVCEKTRVVAMGVTKNMREREPLTEFQNFLIHEFYHAFQQDLNNEGKCRERSDLKNSNTIWMVEGGAHYFATFLVSEINKDKNDVYSDILKIALETYEREGANLVEASPDKSGAAALRLMVERGMLSEESILDGSFFHSCQRELKFDSTSADMKHIRNSWYLIEKKGDIFKFKDLALK